MNVKFKLLRSNSKLPTKSNPDDAGYDAYISKFCKIIPEVAGLMDVDQKTFMISPGERVLCKLGFSTEIESGYYAQIVPRSGLALFGGITIANSPGTIDAGYRNEWGAIIVNTSSTRKKLTIGERICQVIFRKLETVDIEVVDELGTSERGMGGFGSTGDK